MHQYEQQKITEFLAKMRVVLSARGLGRFVCLLDERWQQRLVGLFAIPRATTRRAKFRDDVAELREVRGDWRSIIRHKRTPSKVQLFTEHGSSGNPVPAYTIALCF